VNVKSFTTLPFCWDSISDLIKPFGVDLVLWSYRRLEEDDVNCSLSFFLGVIRTNYRR
jgi:hypothetical protein